MFLAACATAGRRPVPRRQAPDRDAFVAYHLRRFVSAWYTQPAHPMEGGSTIVGHIINEIEHGTRTVAGIPIGKPGY